MATTTSQQSLVTTGSSTGTDPKLIIEIRKRDGRVVSFDLEKIIHAASRAFYATGEAGEAEAVQVGQRVMKDLQMLKRASHSAPFLPHVEMVQDLVEQELITLGFSRTAKAYILYREKRAEIRREKGAVPEHVKNLVSESKKYFRTPLSEFVYYRTYARWIDEENRRESWIETVDRYLGFMRENLGDKLTPNEYSEIRESVLGQKAMPSMRLFQFAGKAARRTNVCAYNCSFIAPSKIQDFAEIVFILMCGTGVGFSVESNNVQALPQVKRQSGNKLPLYVVDDSREGWADALSHGMHAWFDGNDVDFDFSRLRPAGARLKTMGGKSSGPEPLRQLLEFTRSKIMTKQGRRLSNLDAHDIICKIGECVVAGGVRRSALISLSDLDDVEMRDAKKGQFYQTEPQRSLANNSAVYTEKPTTHQFMEEWFALMKSGTGERGIFNRLSTNKTLPQRRLDKAPTGEATQWGTNPCGEIILRSKQFCNLSEVVARREDTEETLLQKVRIATILGTYQSSLTNFQYLSKEWKENCEEERLLGVSITGQWDSPAVRTAGTLEKMRDLSVKVNEEYAKRFGINPSTCITCVKPSGTLSQLVDSSSGMHPRHSQYYIRRIRISATDTLFKMLKDQGVAYYPEVGQSLDSATTFVLEFPVKAPEGAILKDHISAIEQLEHWKLVKKSYTEHNPSVTISVSDDEWIKVANWLYENWDLVGGLSFLPRVNHVYQMAPYEEIDEAKYLELLKRVEHIDFSKIVTYEKEDEVDVKKELACVSGVCEI